MVNFSKIKQTHDLIRGLNKAFYEKIHSFFSTTQKKYLIEALSLAKQYRSACFPEQIKDLDDMYIEIVNQASKFSTKDFKSCYKKYLASKKKELETAQKTLEAELERLLHAMGCEEDEYVTEIELSIRASEDAQEIEDAKNKRKLIRLTNQR